MLLDEEWADKYFAAKRSRFIAAGFASDADLDEVERQKSECLAAIREHTEAEGRQ